MYPIICTDHKLHGVMHHRLHLFRLVIGNPSISYVGHCLPRGRPLLPVSFQRGGVMQNVMPVVKSLLVAPYFAVLGACPILFKCHTEQGRAKCSDLWNMKNWFIYNNSLINTLSVWFVNKLFSQNTGSGKQVIFSVRIFFYGIIHNTFIGMYTTVRQVWYIALHLNNAGGKMYGLITKNCIGRFYQL